MQRWIVYLLVILASSVLVFLFVLKRTRVSQVSQPQFQATRTSDKANQTLIPLSSGFEYPIGNTKRTRKISQSKDGDGWYNAQDFGVNNHLGEDWNAEAGGNADCGEPVYAASNGTIVFAADAGVGWGNVLIVRHRLSDGTLVETLYGHLQSFAKTTGDVKIRERLGNIGDAKGAYPCHLHFELRLADCPSWGAVGPGYNENQAGWTDPSNFIDSHR